MSYLTPEPRGFAGRPLVALVFAVLIGFFGSDILRSWVHLDRLSALAIIIAIAVIVHYVWYWAEKPK
jgi:membrane protein DedA with SNARE-associated domain